MARCQHTHSCLMRKCDHCGTPRLLLLLPSTELRVSLFMWSSRFSITSRLCTLGPRRHCASSVRSGRCAASRLLLSDSRNMVASLSDCSPTSWTLMRFTRSCEACSASDLLVAESGSAHADISTLPSTLVFEVPSVCDQGHGMSSLEFHPLEAPVQVRNQRLRYHVMMTDRCNFFVRLESRVTSL